MAASLPPYERSLSEQEHKENPLSGSIRHFQGLREDRPSPEEIARREKLVKKMKETSRKNQLEAQQKYAAMSPEEKKAKDFSSNVLIKRMSGIPLNDEELQWQFDTLTTEFKRFMLQSPYPVKGKE